jgi:hypothetical protein
LHRGPPRINYDPEIPLLKDTVYIVNPVPPAQDRNAVIEDITGIRCVNCPDAAETAKGIKDGKDEGRVVLVAIHPISLGFFTAPLEGDSFNTQREKTSFKTSLVFHVDYHQAR